MRELFTLNGKKFYLFFDEVAANLQQMAATFLQAVREKDAYQLDTHVRKLEKLEHDNDLVTHKIFIELGKNFITPFDREDIHALASTLDDIADLSYNIVRQVRNYGITETEHATQIIAEQHSRFMEILTKALTELRNKKHLTNLGSQCDAMRTILAQVDNTLDAAIAGVFTKDEENAYAVMKKMDHFELLQALIDKDSNAVNAIESVIVKYA